MISEYILTPVVGAIIGYFTNWLAIKMIFKPYTEKRIFNIKVPFTPGLMPKERYVLSKKIGDVISTHLLTEEVMVNALISTEIHNNIEGIVDKSFETLKNEDKTLKQILNSLSETAQYKDYDLLNVIECKTTDYIIKILQNNELHSKIIDYTLQMSETLLKKSAKDIPLEKISLWIKKTVSDYGIEYINSKDFEDLVQGNINNWINNLNENNKTIDELIPQEVTQKIKIIVQDKIPDISIWILNLVENPTTEQKIKDFIVNLVNKNVGKLFTMFISPSKIAESILDSFKEYLTDENNYIKTYDIITTYFDKLSIMQINDIAEKIPENYKNYPISDNIVKIIRKFCNEENISKILNSTNDYIIRLEDKNLYEIITNIEPDIMSKCRKYLAKQLDNVTKNETIYLYVNEIVNSKINLIMNITLKNICEKLVENNLTIIKNVVLKIYDFIIKKAMLNILKAMNISKIVEDRINDFEIKEAEEIVLQVVNKELNAITMVGALLGFIIGLLPVIIS